MGQASSQGKEKRTALPNRESGPFCGTVGLQTQKLGQDQGGLAAGDAGGGVQLEAGH